jgi:hypothetical protein
MHHKGPVTGSGAQGMLLEQMMEYLTEDQVRTLLVRMIDSRIQMKKALINHMQDKIDTYRMARDMIEEGGRR